MKEILGEKIEMTQIFREDGSVVPVTLIDVSNVFVVGKKSQEKDGYASVVMGKGKNKKPNKAEAGKYKALDFAPFYVKESKLLSADLNIGDKIEPNIFAVNDKVDVVGVTKSKGFQGVVKRWGFHGGPKTHGQSDRNRAPGSIGSGTTPGRVYKGKKMAGRMGGDTKTIKNLRVMMVDVENGIIAVKGAIPGHRGSLVILKLNK